MRAVYMRLASLLLLLLLRLSTTHLTEAAAVKGGGGGNVGLVGGANINAAVDKEVAPVGVVKTDLLSLEQEIGGNPAAEQQGAAGRKARSFLFSLGAGPAWIGGSLGYGYGYAGYGYPGYGYSGYNYPYYSGYGSGYYPGVFGYQKIIIG